jgi:signal transduction histidine kinase
MSSAKPTFENASPVSLDAVISTSELTSRPSRPADYQAESAAMIELAQEMVASPDGVLRKLAETALTLCHAGSSGVSLLEPDGAHFHWPAITGAWAPHVGGGTPREFGPCGTVLDRNAPQLMRHPERHFRYLAAVTPGIEEALLIPFYNDGKAVGTIWVIAHDAAHQFDAEDLRVMTSLSTFAAAAYQMLEGIARMESSQRELRDSLAAQQKLQEQTEETIKRRTKQLASSNQMLMSEIDERIQAQANLTELSSRVMQTQDDERRRIARELHDATGQVLAALKMDLVRMQRDSSPANAAKFTECLKLIDSASSEIRNLSYLLHPPLMDELGLNSAIGEYAAGFGARSGLKVTVDISGDVGRLHGSREISLFRIVQEGLGNIHRHSGSATAHIRIFREQEKVMLKISDCGRGVQRSEDGKVRYGVGLTSMQERLRPFGGVLSVESSPAGTTVTAVLPKAAAVIPE